jgi:hypothetical protein
MGETSRDIEAHIEQQRRELGQNVGVLQYRVKNALNWRTHMEERPLTMLGIAFAGGLLVSLAVRRRNGNHRRDWSSVEQDTSPRSATRPALAYQKRKALDAWDNVRGALLGVAAGRIKRFLADAIPGFDEEYQKAERERSAAAGDWAESYNVPAA